MAMGYVESKELLKMRNVTKDHWDTVQQWRIDEGKSFAKSKSSAIARMAAGGIRSGSQQWQDNLARIESANAAEKKSQSGSATQGILDRWTNTMKDFYVDASKQVVDQGSGSDRDEQRGPQTSASNAMRALNQYGEGKNVYTQSGLSEVDFRNLSTDEFMTLSFGASSAAKVQAEEDEIAATQATADLSRQKAADAQTQTASPWWA